jgi:vacuolar-type H+-ATPase subunit H
MLSKLLALLSTAKGAAAATVVAAAVVGTGVAATNQDVRDAVTTTVQSVTESNDAKASNQPAIVAARNDADKKLRDAFRDDQQKLEKLHSTHVGTTDRAKLDDTVNTADAALRARLTKALNDVAALTLGREGLESPKPTDSPDVKASFTTDAQKKVDDIVSAAIKDMDKIVKDAETAVAALPALTPGKPGDPGKPATVPTPPSHP